MRCIRQISLSALDFIFLVILPIGPLSWFAVTALCLHILVSTNDPSLRRGAVILFATTVPMLWSRILFRFLPTQFCRSMRHWLVGCWVLIGWETWLNLKSGSGQLVILPSCSSLANVSLAFLCWVTVSQFVGHKMSAYDILWCLMACASVVAVNVTRISLMGLNLVHYDGIITIGATRS